MYLYCILLALLTEFQSSDLEVDSYGRYKRRIESVLGESKYYTGLPNSAVADEKKLEKQVKILLRHFGVCFEFELCYVTGRLANGEWGVVTNIREPEPEITHSHEVIKQTTPKRTKRKKKRNGRISAMLKRNERKIGRETKEKESQFTIH